MNIEGFLTLKEKLVPPRHISSPTLACDILCIEEMNRDHHQQYLKIADMRGEAERPDSQDRSAIPDFQILSVTDTEQDTIEMKRQ